MAPVTVDPDSILTFADGAALEAWYRANHAGAGELWLRVGRKGSGLVSVSIGEALDLALCWGWIDAIRKGFDAQSYLQRYTPRGRKSIWSQVNRTHIERLTEAGRMQAPGLAQVALAKADGRWDRAYAAGSKLETPAALLAAIEAVPAALATYEKLNASNRFALAFRLHNLRTEAGRQKRIAAFVEMLAEGRTIYPQDLEKARARRAERP